MRQTTIDYLGESGELIVANPSKHGKDGNRLFKFNKVFGPATTQGTLLILFFGKEIIFPLDSCKERKNVIWPRLICIVDRGGLFGYSTTDTLGLGWI